LELANIERLWRSVKYENGVDLYKGLNQYFNFYNKERMHQSLNYKTPNQLYCIAA